MNKLKRLLTVILAAVMIMCSAQLNNLVGSEWFTIKANAATEEGTLIKISTAEELSSLASNVNSGNTYEGITVELTTNIDMADVAWKPIGYNFNNYFAGIFDGNNYIISNLKTEIAINAGNIINSPYHTSGLFGICSGATIMNVVLASPQFAITNESGYQNDYSSIDGTCVYAGGICGYADNTVISNVVVSNATISAYTGTEAGRAYAGGIVGYARNGCDLSYCYIQSGTVSGTSDSASADCAAGGIVGEMLNEGTISRCANYASVNGGHSVAAAHTGGICGKTANTSTTLSLIRDCYNQGNIRHSGSWLESGYAGGVAGYSYSSIINCYSTGTITASTNTVGGSVYVSGIAGSGASASAVEGCVAACSSISGGTSHYMIAGTGSKSNNAALSSISGSPSKDATATYTMDTFTTSELYIETLGWDFNTVWQQTIGEMPTLLPKADENAADMALVNEAVAQLKIIYADGETYSTVKSNISFSNSPNEADVAWSSDNESVISNSGTVTRGSEDTQVRITATVSSGDYSLSKIFVLNVLGTESVESTEAQDWGMDIDSARTLVAMMRNSKIKDISADDVEVQVLMGNNTDEDALASFMANFMTYLEVPGESAFLKDQMGDVIETIKAGTDEEYSKLVSDFSDGLVNDEGINEKTVAKKVIAIPQKYYTDTTIDFIGAYSAIKNAADFSNDPSKTLYENSKDGLTKCGEVLDCITKTAGSSLNPSNIIENAFTAFELMELYEAYEIHQQNAAKSYIKQYLDLREHYAKDSIELQLFMEAKAATSTRTEIENIDEFCEALYTVYDKFTYHVEDEYKVIIKCPVEVHVYDQNGKLVGRVIDNNVDHSIKNSLLITIGGENNDEKTIHIQDNEAYSIKLIGSDTGSMEVEVTNENNNTSYVYENIPLELNKEMLFEVSSEQMQQESKGDIVLLEEGIYTEDVEGVDTQSTLHNLKIFVCEEDVLGNITLYNFGIQPVDTLVEQGADISGYLTLASNCSLVGYFTDLACTTAYEELTMPDADLTLYAKCIRTDDRINITQQPQNVSCIIGSENVTVNFELSASVDYTIQWYKKGIDAEAVELPGANAATISINTEAAEEADYFAVIRLVDEDVAVRTDSARVVVKEKTVTASGTCGDNLVWELLEDTELIISGNGEMAAYDSGSSPWGQYAAGITSVSVSDGITSISEYAFENFTMLEALTIPDTVTSIGEYALVGCTSLRSLTLPFVGSSRTSNGTYDAVLGHIFGRTETGTIQYHRSEDGSLYYYNYAIPASLVEVILTNDEIIPMGAFHNCSNLTNIVLNDGITTIGGYAFANASAITELTIPNSVNTIAEYALSGCTSLETLIIPFVGSSRDATGTYDAVFGHIFGRANEGTVQYYQLADGSLSGYRYAITASLKNVVITDDPTIALGAFSNCGTLSTVELQKATEGIENCAFYGVSALDQLIIKNSECNIYNSSNCIGISGTMYGYAGSTAETFANSYGIAFVALEDEVHTHAGGTANCKEPAICDTCGEYYGEIDAEKHITIEIDEAVAATCTSTGLTEGSHCDGCGEILIAQSEIEMLSHSFTNGSCTVCGAEDPDYIKPSTVPTISLKYPTVSFEDVIVMNVYYTASELEDVLEIGLITYSQKPESYGVENAEAVVSGYTYSESDLMYYSSTAGIAPKDVGDTIYFAVYAKLADGTYTYTSLISYSPKTYAYNQLKSGSTEMRPLVVAMLNYGAAAQIYFGYKTDALMNADLTEEQKAMVTSYSADLLDTVTQASETKLGEMQNNGGYSRRYPTISFEGAFSINYYFLPSSTVADEVTMYIWTLEDYNAVTSLNKSNASKTIKMTLTESGEYLGTVDGITAKELDQAVYVSFCYSDGTTDYCSGVIGYSIGAYCTSQAAKTGTLADLAAACAVYGYYAKSLFSK